MTRTIVVTGAFGYSGRHVAERLLTRGDRVRTLTGRSAADSPFGDRVPIRPLAFDHPTALADSLRGAAALVNTYWIRFEHGEATYDRAIRNTRRLFAAAREAGVGRVVHVSITSPSESSRLPYFRGKAVLERELRESGMPHTIVRPTVLFGGDDVLVNNIAFLIRRLPLFGVPGRGRYPVQPVHVGDLADLLVAATDEDGTRTVDAVGPETFPFVAFVRRIRDAVGVRTPVWPMPKWLVFRAGRVAGRRLGDVVLTKDEIRGLAGGLLVSRDPPRGPTAFTEWLRANAEDLGREYASELARHFRSDSAV